MILYADSSALLKRVVVEAESATVRAVLAERAAAGDLVTASSLAWLEVWRALRRAHARGAGVLVAQALSGVAEHELTPEVLAQARQVGPDGLRTLDALHLASVVAVSADAVLTFDHRLAEAVRGLGIEVYAPT